MQDFSISFLGTQAGFGIRDRKAEPSGTRKWEGEGSLEEERVRAQQTKEKEKGRCGRHTG